MSEPLDSSRSKIGLITFKDKRLKETLIQVIDWRVEHLDEAKIILAHEKIERDCAAVNIVYKS